jgi:hypothetical protein
LAAPLHILPQLWFRNQWDWKEEKKIKPKITLQENPLCLVADDTEMDSPEYLLFDYHLGPHYLYAAPGTTYHR